MNGAAGAPTGSVPPPASLARLKLVALALLGLCLAADLLSKGWLQDLLVLLPGEHASERTIDLLPGFFALEGTWNPGVTFGLAPGKTLAILALTSVATVGLLTWLLATRNPSRLLHLGLGLILSGALGNLYDRIRWHEVRDFFLIYLGTLEKRSFTWPNFNVADACIVTGVGLVVLEALFGRHGVPAPAGPPAPPPSTPPAAPGPEGEAG